jgi:hypothetical protein
LTGSSGTSNRCSRQVELWMKTQVTDATAKLIDLMRTLIGDPRS